MRWSMRASTLSLVMLVSGVGCDSGGAEPKDDGSRFPEVAPATVERISNYRDWGWESIVLENDMIRIAAVPSIGGRIMEFSLDEHESMWVNGSQVGNTPTPSAQAWPNHGGYKNWPAPQSRWNWPPPPVLDYGPYEAEIVAESPDSVSIRLSGEVERIRTPGLRFERTLTTYAGTSKVRVAQTIVNEGTESGTWSMWDITQTLAQHAPARDFDNFRVYFPVNPNSRFGPDGVRTDRPSQAWFGKINEDIYEVRFQPDNAKLFADSRAGWVAYVDLRDGYAYVKTFDVDDEGSYPDQGADVEVYVSNQNYFEVEVLSPLVPPAAGGGSYTFTEIWAASRTDGPVLDVTDLGLVNQRLSINGDGRVVGRYGVFVVGLARLVVVDSEGNELLTSEQTLATPTQRLVIDEEFALPANADRIELVLDDESGTRIGMLDSVHL